VLSDLVDLLDKLRDVEGLIETVGYVGLFAIVFAETGLLIGFFLPGDTLLLTAGLLAQRGELSIWVLIPLLIVAAVTGDATGYAIGRQAGARLFVREDARFFRRRHLERAKAFYEKHGGKTIVIARFLAIIRTFAPTVAGAAEMKYPRFALYNIAGGALWVTSMTLLGYFVGKAVPNLDAVFFGIVALIVVVSVAPAVIHLRRERAIARSEAAKGEAANT
jgi:membrane-associated protein